MFSARDFDSSCLGFRLCIVVLALLVVGVSPRLVSADQANWELAEKWMPDCSFDRLYSTGVSPHWLPDEERFWYSYLDAEGRHYWLVNPARPGKKPLFDHDRFAERLTELCGEPQESTELNLGALDFAADGRSFDFAQDERYFNYDLRKKELSEIDPPAPLDAQDPTMSLSPDGKTGAFLLGNNLHVCDPDDVEHDSRQVSSDGARGYAWGKDWELFDDDDPERRPAPVFWSPDSRYFCIFRADCREVEDLWLVDHLAQPRPTLTTYKCPFPGEQTPRWELWIFDRASERLTQLALDRWPDQTLDDLFGDTAWWSADSRTLFLTRRSRDYMSVDLLACDPSNPQVEILIEERLKGQVYVREPRFIDDERFLWWSMRDGWGHYYLYSREGKLLTQVTRGDFNTDEIIHVNEKRLLFVANGREPGRNPYYRHLYSVKLNGENIRLITPEDAEHRVHVSPGGDYIVDDYSRADQPNRILLRDARGKRLLKMEEADISRLIEAGWQAPEIFKALSADAVTEQWGVMFKPFDFDSTRSYPIITRVYPGRQGEFIPRGFRPMSSSQTLAQFGCIVVQFGNRGGTMERGLAYREHGREEFRDYGLADKRSVIEQLGRRHDFIDLERVGIFGGSSGGFMAISAMLVHPDFFKVAVAATAPNDPSIYYNHWAERYGVLEYTAAGEDTLAWRCEVDGNLELADRLRGHLLMINGTQDGNVHPAQLLRMADAFIRAGKRFDMFFIPGADHGLGDWRYFYILVWTYFTEHLIGDPTREVDIF